MYSGELEVQAKRKAIAILQDEINRILNATRELSSLPDMIVKKDKQMLKDVIEQITSLEDEVDNLRKKITKEISDVGGLVVNKENLLNTAYTMDEIVDEIIEVAIGISNMKISTLKSFKFDKELTKLIEVVIEEVYKLNEIIRSINTDVNNSIELSYDMKSIVRELHKQYRQLVIKCMNEITNTKELLFCKDILYNIVKVSDKCKHVSDLFVLLALS